MKNKRVCLWVLGAAVVLIILFNLLGCSGEGEPTWTPEPTPAPTATEPAAAPTEPSPTAAPPASPASTPDAHICDQAPPGDEAQCICRAILRDHGEDAVRAALANEAVLNDPAMQASALSCFDEGAFIPTPTAADSGGPPSLQGALDREGIDVPPTFPEAVLVLTNAARAEGATCGAYDGLNLDEHMYAPGAQALTMDAQLAQNAQAHAEHMARTGEFEHQAMDAIRASGGSGENIGVLWGPQDVPTTLVDGWLESPGHCHNLMNPGWESIGIGVARADDGSVYGVQVFGGKFQRVAGGGIGITVDGQIDAINELAGLPIEERLEVLRWAVEETWREQQYEYLQAGSCAGLPLDKEHSAKVRFAYVDDPTATPNAFAQFPPQGGTSVLDPDLYEMSDYTQTVVCDADTTAVWIAAVYGGSAAIGTLP